MLDELIDALRIPTQALRAGPRDDAARSDRAGARRSIWCSSRSPAPRRPIASFGVDSAAARAKRAMRRHALKRGTLGQNVMYFETGQGSALSADAHHGVDQQTLRGAGLWCCPRLRTVAGQHGGRFIGPEYLYDGKQIIRAGLEDHFCGKLLGCRWAATSATPTTPRPIRTTWTPC